MKQYGGSHSLEHLANPCKSITNDLEKSFMEKNGKLLLILPHKINNA